MIALVFFAALIFVSVSVYLWVRVIEGLNDR